MRKSFIVLLLSALVFISGCTSTSTGADGLSEPGSTLKVISMEISHTFYNPSTIDVSRGDTVRIMAVAARGTGAESGLSHNHGITIDEYGINEAVTSETTPTVVEFVADRAGTFSIYCKTCWDGPFGREHPDIRATLVVR